MLYSYELTKWQGIRDYRPFDYLTREEAARFMVEFAENVLCRKKQEHIIIIFQLMMIQSNTYKIY